MSCYDYQMCYVIILPSQCNFLYIIAMVTVHTPLPKCSPHQYFTYALRQWQMYCGCYVLVIIICPSPLLPLCHNDVIGCYSQQQNKQVSTTPIYGNLTSTGSYFLTPPTFCNHLSLSRWTAPVETRHFLLRLQTPPTNQASTSTHQLR